MKYHVKKGDKVLVNAGNYKGEEATILAVLTNKDRVVLEFTSKKDREIGKRTIKKSKLNPNGGLVERSVSSACLQRQSGCLGKVGEVKCLI